MDCLGRHENAFALLAALVVFSIREYVPKDDSV